LAPQHTAPRGTAPRRAAPHDSAPRRTAPLRTKPPQTIQPTKPNAPNRPPGNPITANPNPTGPGHRYLGCWTEGRPRAAPRMNAAFESWPKPMLRLRRAPPLPQWAGALLNASDIPGPHKTRSNPWPLSLTSILSAPLSSKCRLFDRPPPPPRHPSDRPSPLPLRCPPTKAPRRAPAAACATRTRQVQAPSWAPALRATASATCCWTSRSCRTRMSLRCTRRALRPPCRCVGGGEEEGAGPGLVLFPETGRWEVGRLWGTAAQQPLAAAFPHFPSAPQASPRCNDTLRPRAPPPTAPTPQPPLPRSSSTPPTAPATMETSSASR
jgi:hypothetical protein